MISELIQNFGPTLAAYLNTSPTPQLHKYYRGNISHAVRFIPFDPHQHNTRTGIRAALPNVTDAFVAAAWLVKNGQPQSAETFGNLFDFDAARHRAFWGINQAGQPTIGVSTTLIDSVALDSGASTSLAYKGESLVSDVPRPVPHVVGLMPPYQTASCAIASATKPHPIQAVVALLDRRVLIAKLFAYSPRAK